MNSEDEYILDCQRKTGYSDGKDGRIKEFPQSVEYLEAWRNGRKERLENGLHNLFGNTKL